MKTVREMADFLLELQAREAYRPEPPLQMTSRIPADLKIKLDTCAEYMGLTRNALLIEILEAALPDVEKAIDEHQIIIESVGAHGHRGPFNYRQAFDWAMQEYRNTGKAPLSAQEASEALNQKLNELLDHKDGEGQQ